MANTREHEEIVVMLAQILNNIKIFLVMQIYRNRQRHRVQMSQNRKKKL